MSGNVWKCPERFGKAWKGPERYGESWKGPERLGIGPEKARTRPGQGSERLGGIGSDKDRNGWRLMPGGCEL
jgi:hypothetical protein